MRTRRGPTADRSVARASWAVAAVFALNGFNFATWAARLPSVRDGLALRPDQMGLLLLVGSLGSLAGLPVSGMVVQRLGAARTVVAFSLANTAGLCVAAVGVQLASVPLVAGGLALFGIGTGVWDAAMNLEGAAVEQQLGRTVMPRYHAGFSFGTVVAAGLAALVAGVGVPVVVHLPVAVGLSLCTVLVAVRFFLPSQAERVATEPRADGAPLADPADTPPRGARHALAAWTEPRTLLIGVVVLGAALTEGAANDWASLAVVDGFHVSNAVGALGFGLFVAAMTTTRLFGTGLLDRFGRVTVLRGSAAFALVGLVVFGLGAPLWVALLGVMAWGAGAALGFPVGMSASADDPARAPLRLAVVSTIGYTAFLAGPPLLGLLAHQVGYRHALLAVAVPVLLGLLVVGSAAPLRPERAAAGTGAAPATDGSGAADGMEPGPRGAGDGDAGPTVEAAQEHA